MLSSAHTEFNINLLCCRHDGYHFNLCPSITAHIRHINIWGTLPEKCFQDWTPKIARWHSPVFTLSVQCLIFFLLSCFIPPFLALLVRSRWPEDVPPYIPSFYDGWKPPAPTYRPSSPPQYSAAPITRSNSQRFPSGRPAHEEVKPNWLSYF